MRKKSDNHEMLKSEKPRSLEWAFYFSDGPIASEMFMEEIENLPVQERSTETARLQPKRKN
jgi:hypothetical protein